MDTTAIQLALVALAVILLCSGLNWARGDDRSFSRMLLAVPLLPVFA